jgi:hypothetical protein
MGGRSMQTIVDLKQQFGIYNSVGCIEGTLKSINALNKL